ncbi:MAG: EVE domain-containing protein, partial [Alcanivoracaceae bacterium]
YDPKSSPDSPRWFQVTLRHVRTLPAPVPLAVIRTETALQDMELVRRPRLSVQKVTAAEAKHIQLMAKSQH